MRLYTIGHSTRELDELVELLSDHGVDRLADIRRWPSSRKHPQFNRGTLSSGLGDATIAYRWYEELGGYVDQTLPPDESPNAAWDTDGFRNYADRALTDDAWHEALDAMLDWADDGTPAYMCAELGWWRCHRRIVSDWLVAAGHEVRHIVDADRVTDHELADWAEIDDDGRVTYPG